MPMAKSPGAARGQKCRPAGELTRDLENGAMAGFARGSNCSPLGHVYNRDMLKVIYVQVNYGEPCIDKHKRPASVRFS